MTINDAEATERGCTKAIVLPSGSVYYWGGWFNDSPTDWRSELDKRGIAWCSFTVYRPTSAGWYPFCGMVAKV